jgi:hypothetical protein
LIGFKENEAIDESVFKKKIIEQENKWSIKPSDEDLGFSLDSQLSILNQTLLQDELGDEKEYDNLEDYYCSEEDSKEYKVRCHECNNELELVASYMGVTDSEERAMGAENYHTWAAETLSKL